MKLSGEKKGPVIFFLILIAVAVVALAAFTMTGPMGIEDRFTTAVGLPAGDAETGTPGFSVEGDPVLYGIVLVILLAAGFVAVRFLPQKKPEDGQENPDNTPDGKN